MRLIALPAQGPTASGGRTPSQEPCAEPALPALWRRLTPADRRLAIGIGARCGLPALARLVRLRAQLRPRIVGWPRITEDPPVRRLFARYLVHSGRIGEGTGRPPSTDRAGAPFRLGDRRRSPGARSVGADLRTSSTGRPP